MNNKNKTNSLLNGIEPCYFGHFSPKNKKMKYDLIKFEDGEFSLDVNVSPEEETVWLTQNDMALLFGVNRTRVTRHVNNIINEGELPVSVCAENALTASDGKVYLVKYYH